MDTMISLELLKSCEIKRSDDFVTVDAVWAKLKLISPMFDDDGFILKEIVSVSPFLRFIDSTSVFTANGRDFPVSTTPILFSAHSVNQI